MSGKPVPSNLQKIKFFDLNLLIEFEVIFIFSSVKLAAEKLNMSSSSVSQSLNKLRQRLSDPLFVRDGQKLVPTTTAIKFHLLIGNELGSLVDKILNFTSNSEHSRFVIYSSTYAAQRILPDLCAALDNSELKCNIEHISADSALNSGEDILAHRKADIVFDTQPYYAFSTVTKKYLSDKIIAVSSNKHPRVNEVLTKEIMKNEPSTFLNVKTLGLLRTQRKIMEYLGERDFNFESSSIMVNASVSAKSDKISLIPEWFYAEIGESLGLKKLTCDFDFDPVDHYIAYNKSMLSNTNFVRLLEVMESITKVSLQ